MAGKAWEDWEIEEILKIKSGASFADVVKALPHRSVQSVRGKVFVLGLSPKKVLWTEEEDQILKDNYPGKPYSALEKLLPRWKESAIKARACKLGITQGQFNHPHAWSAAEDEIIRQNYRTMRCKEMCALLPGRSPMAVKSRVESLKLVKTWTEEEKSIVAAHYGKISRAEFKALLPYRTYTAIQAQAWLMGVTGEAAKPWEDWEIDILTKHYSTIPNKELCKMLPDRTPAKMRAKAHDLGITSDLSWSDEEKEVVKEWYGKISRAELAEMLPGRSVGGISVIAEKLGVVEKKESPAIAWTQEEDEIMFEHYSTEGPTGVQKMLSYRTVSSVRSRAKVLGVKYRLSWEDWEEQAIRDNYYLMPLGALTELLPHRTVVAITQRARQIGFKKEINWWTKEEDEILCANYGKLKMPRLQLLLPERTDKSIMKRAGVLGLQEQGPARWTEEEDKLMRSRYKTAIVEQLQELFPGRSGSAIYKRAETLGLQQRYVYSADQNFFETPNLKNSYWAGFIAADGCIVGKQSVCIDLNPIDRDHIEKFVADTCFTGPIKEAEYPGFLYGKPRMCKHCSVSVSCAPLWPEHLEKNFNITKRKSLTLQPPEGLTNKQAIAFIAGYFDGDGCVMLAEKGDAFWINMSFVGTFAMMEWIQHHCDRIAPAVSKREGSKARRERNIATYGVSGRRANILVREILKLDIPRLTRKWDGRMQQFLGWKNKGHFQPSLFCPPYSA